MLARANRLAKAEEFALIARTARPVHSRFLILKKIKSGDTASRFGIVISAKISKKSTERNKIRRRLREILRQGLPSVRKGFLVMLVAKSEIKGKNYRELEEDLVFLFQKAGLI